MRRILVGIAVLPCIVGTAVADAATKADTQESRRCTAQRINVDDLRSTNLMCGSARKVARRWLNADGCPTKGHCTVRIGRVRWGCHATRQGRRSSIFCNPYAQPKNIQFAYTEPAPSLTDDEAVEQILGQLTDDGAISSTEDVEWNYDPCERVSRAIVTCTYWYENGQGRWEGRTRVRETLDAYVLKDLYVESRP